MPKVPSFKTLWERPSPTSISRARAKVSGALNSVTRAVQRTARAHRTSASSSSVASSFEDASTSTDSSSQDIETPQSTSLDGKDTDTESEIEVVSTSSSDDQETSSSYSLVVPATPCDTEDFFTAPTPPPETLDETIESRSLQEQPIVDTHLPVNAFADSHATPVISTYYDHDNVVHNSINIKEEEETSPLSYTDLACNTGLVDAWTTISSPSSGATQHPEQRTLSSLDSLFASGMLVDPRAVPMEVFFSSSHMKRKRTPEDEDQSSDRAHDYHYATDRPSKRRATATFNIPKLIVPDHPIPTEATRRQQEYPVGAQTHYVDVFMTSDNESDSEASSSSSSDTSSSSAASEYRGRSRVRRARDFQSRRRSAAPSPPPSSYASSCFEDASYDLSYSEVQIKSEPLF